jgi:hypothetical protein
MRDFAFVMAEREGTVTAYGSSKKVVYRPVAIKTYTSDQYLIPLVSDEQGLGVAFEDFKDAEKVVRRYEEGPDENCRTAEWNKEVGYWDCVEETYEAPRREREYYVEERRRRRR